MGIRGFGKLLRERGLVLCSSSDEILCGSTGCVDRVDIPARSTLAIDGSSLVFAIFEKVYNQHVCDVMKYHNERENPSGNNIMKDDDFWMLLLPSMVSLSSMERVTRDILTFWLEDCQFNIRIYLDGRSAGRMSFKADTDMSRLDHHEDQIQHLKRFCQKHILPPAVPHNLNGTTKIRNKEKIRDSTCDEAGLNGLVKVMLQYFPKPPLFFQQIVQTFRQLSHQCHDEDFTDDMNMTIIQCDDEADRHVAMTSAIDTSNKTFAVSNDSDYYFFGFPQRSHLWILGDAAVQYLPLDQLINSFDDSNHRQAIKTKDKKTILSAVVLTRKDVANILHIPIYQDQLLIEISILLGNDYTRSFVDSTTESFIRTTNIYKQNPHLFINHGNKKRNEFIEDLLQFFTNPANQDYEIASDDFKFQAAINYTRDHYQFKDVSHHYDEKKDSEYSEDTSATTTKDDKSYCTYNLNYSVVRELVKKMVKEDNSWDTLRHQILAPFRDRHTKDCNEEFPLKLLTSTLDDMYYNNNCQLPPTCQTKFTMIPSGLEWHHLLHSQQLQQSISFVLRQRSKLGISNDTTTKFSNPSLFFNTSLFFNQYISHEEIMNNKLKYNNNDNESTRQTESLHDSDEVTQKPIFIKDVTDDGETSYRQPLPIDEYKDNILDNIRENRVTIIQGETGCGKSSRVPVMILEAPPPDPSAMKMKKVKLFICQPRRIAAKSLVERIRSTEPHLKPYIGLRLGHGVREYETKQTRAWFVTTGYLVKLMANHPERFDDCTHLIIDEVHERSIDTDLLCLLSRRLLSYHPHIRLILMSATIVADMYRNYYEVLQPPIFVGVRSHPIQEYYLDDKNSLAKHLHFSKKESNLAHNVFSHSMKMRCKVSPSRTYMEQLRQLAFHTSIAVASRGSSVLIFVPGMDDIISITELFDELNTTTIYKCVAIHSEIPLEEQLNAFIAPGHGEVKVIIATNAAESSLTLPDVDHVICLGLCKQIFYNPSSHRQKLETTWISKASATQRAGRTGRVRKGYVYRLYSKIAYETYMIKFDIGEILRMPLDSVILNLRTIVGEESVTQILSECLEVPDINNIERSLINLHKTNFINEPHEHFDMTPLGNFVVSLGIDLNLGAFIGYGVVLGVAAEAVEIAAIISTQKSPWLIPNALMQEPETYNSILSKTFVSKAYFDTDLYSEPLAVMNLIWEWSHSQNRRNFCSQHGVHPARMKHLIATRDSLCSRVAFALNLDLDKLYVRRPPNTMNIEKICILRILHVWIFHETMIILECDSLKESKQYNAEQRFAVPLTGDRVSESHLYQFLDKKRHKFELENVEHVLYHGIYRNEAENSSPLEMQEFEKRLISLSIEGNFSFVLLDGGTNITIYFKSSFEDIFSDSFDFDRNLILCTRRNISHSRGWKERDCGAWICQNLDANTDGGEGKSCDSLSITKLALCFVSKNKLPKYFKELKKKIKLHCENHESISAFCLKLSEERIERPRQFQLSTHGQCSYIPTERILSDLFGTAKNRLNLTRIERNLSQKIVFNHMPTIRKNPCLFQGRNIPEGARIITALAGGNRSRYMIRLRETDKESNVLTETNNYINIFPGGTRINDRWKQPDLISKVVVDSASVAASTLINGKDKVYACCASTLELSNGSLLAERLTLLPPGSTFYVLAMRCIGIHIGLMTNTILENEGLLHDADKLFSHLKNHGTDMPKFNPTATKLLCKLFESFLIPREPEPNTTLGGVKLEKLNEAQKVQEQVQQQQRSLNEKESVSEADENEAEQFAHKLDNQLESNTYKKRNHLTDLKEKSVNTASSTDTVHDHSLVDVLEKKEQGNSDNGSWICNDGLVQLNKFSLAFGVPINTDQEENKLQVGYKLQYHCLFCQYSSMEKQKIINHLIELHPHEI